MQSSSWMPNPFKRSATITGTQKLLSGDGDDSVRDASESEFGSQAVPISPANMPLSPGTCGSECPLGMYSGFMALVVSN